jgi:hypothetical protein
VKVAVIGASAGVGLEVVKQLIGAGDSVTTLSRRTDSIPDSPQVTRVQGRALNETDVLRKIEGADAVLVTLGTGMSTKAAGLYPITNGLLTQRYQVATDLDKSTKIGKISRKDVAHFMVKQAKSPTCIGKYPALSYQPAWRLRIAYRE